MKWYVTPVPFSFRFASPPFPPSCGVSSSTNGTHLSHTFDVVVPWGLLPMTYFIIIHHFVTTTDPDGRVGPLAFACIYSIRSDRLWYMYCPVSALNGGGSPVLLSRISWGVYVRLSAVASHTLIHTHSHFCNPHENNSTTPSPSPFFSLSFMTVSIKILGIISCYHLSKLNPVCVIPCVLACA